MKRKNTSLNVLKGICAILIVFNHCKFPGTFGLLIEGYSRIAVPIFFMISGYYSYKNDKIKLKKKIKHIFILLIGSSLFYLVFNCLRYTILNDTNSLKLYLHNFFKLKSIIKCIMLNENHFWPHLWFLNALLYVYIIQYFVSEKQKYFPEKVLSYILLSSYLVLNFLVIKDDFSNAILIRNFIFVGIPFFLIGKNIRFSELEKK